MVFWMTLFVCNDAGLVEDLCKLFVHYTSFQNRLRHQTSQSSFHFEEDKKERGKKRVRDHVAKLRLIICVSDVDRIDEGLISHIASIKIHHEEKLTPRRDADLWKNLPDELNPMSFRCS